MSDEKHPTSGAPRDDDHSVAKAIRWEDFRDHLATAEKDGRRKWIYPKMVSGLWYKRRTYLSWFLLGLMFIGPFVKINGNPLLLVNVVERKFSILGRIFWPQDMVIFAVAMLLFLTGIIIFTTAFGRLWCGWTCPQTVLMEMVFRKIEYWIEGDARSQRALDAAPWTGVKVLKKGIKHSVFLGLSFLISNWLLSYIIGIEKLLEIIVDDPRHHITGLAFMLGFTAIFYLIFARFREQACTFICPYGRFQSAILDENTMLVAYDHKRGERRGPINRRESLEARRSAGVGDCVNCRECVSVCPTGIDIRNGVQMECVNCTACIDACDRVMDKIGRPRGLIHYASLNSIEKGKPFCFTARMAWYATVLSALIFLFCGLVFTRSEVETIFLRAPGALYQTTEDGRISNLYTLKVINKSRQDYPLQLKLENHAGELRVLGNSGFKVEGEKLAQTSVLIILPPETLKEPKTKLKVGVYSQGKLLQTIDTIFSSPRNSL